jgi:hypothetical protein
VYAQLVEHPTVSDRGQSVTRIVQEELLPSLLAEPGFSGAVDLSDRISGNSLTIVFWETAEAAFRPPSEYNARFRRALATIAEISGREFPLSVWEVDAYIQQGSRNHLRAVQAG